LNKNDSFYLACCLLCFLLTWSLVFINIDIKSKPGNQMFKKITLTALLLTSFVSANASVMTFNDLKDGQLEPYSENGMTVTTDGGDFSTWPEPGVAHLDSLHDSRPIGGPFIDFIFSGGSFDLISVEISKGAVGLLSDENPPDVLAVNNVMWEAFAGDTLVKSQNTSSLTANTIRFDSGFSGIDKARVTVISDFDGQDAALSHFSIDNVSFQTASVPIPATAWLFGSGLIGVLLRRKANQ
jgi:hypothetical protein